MEKNKNITPLMKYVFRSKLARRIIYCFSLFVVILGLTLGYFIGFKDWLEYVDMKDWTEVPAKIISSDLVSKKIDNRPSYRVEAEYEYDFQGQAYSGSRVTIWGGFDSNFEKHDQRHGELTECVDSGKLFRCFVNPVDAEKSVLYRTMIWDGFYIALVVMINSILYGLFMIWGMRWIIRKNNRPDPSSTEEKNEDTFNSTLAP